MEVKIPVTGDTSEIEFNSIFFEKKLTGLKDSQESINSCCHWCLQNRQHHKKIVSCWLNVLKRVKIEHRLTLFYLANDVIQYSKRRNYDFVESWGTTLQKATTMVRDEKVKHKILRIFKIWEQRNIYGEEFITDLCGLISASPSTRKGDEPHEFQSSYLIQKIRNCSKLEGETDVKLRHLKEHNPKIQLESDSLILSLKDRAHVDDVEKEIEDYTKQMENYINALKCEIKARIHLISLLAQAETQLENDKKDVKLVTNAYRTFSGRVKALKKKLDEKIPTLTSPPPSPDINAPSPSPDSDIELPGNENNNSRDRSSTPTCTPNLFNNTAALYTNAGYYNPVPPPAPDATNSFNSNNFSSFIGTNMPFSLQNFNPSSLFDSNQNQNVTTNTTSQTQTTNSYSINNAISSLFPSMACPPPPPAPNMGDTTPTPQPQVDYQYNNSSHVPLLPPPMPPFGKSDDSYGAQSYGETYNGGNNTNYANAIYEPTTTPYQPTPQPYEPTTPTYQSPAATIQPPPTTTYESFNSNYPPAIVAPPYQNPEPPIQTPITNYPPAPYHPPAEEYNPEEELETWEPEPTWEQPPPVELDTPESPPMFEKAGYGDPVEYHDGTAFEGAEDVDHRVLPTLITDPIPTDKEIGHRIKDVDHRNLISLTGSPNETRPVWSNQGGDQDYRKSSNVKSNLDQDYRVPFDIENLKLPPPPPPPNMLANHGLGSNPFNPLNRNPPPLPMDQGMPDIDSSPPHKNPSPPKFNQPKRHGLSPRKLQDNTESIDMDLSDDGDDNQEDKNESEHELLSAENTRNTSPGSDCFELPPPFPDLFDDVDANNFLDNVTEELDLEDFAASDFEGMDQTSPNMKPGLLGHAPPPPFPPGFMDPQNMFNALPSPMDMPSQDAPPNWMNQNQGFNNEFQNPPQEFHNEEFHNEEFHNVEFRNEDFHNVEFRNEDFHKRDFPFRGRGGNIRGNFNNNRGTRGGNWVNRGNNEFRGRGRGGPPRGVRGGVQFRGNRGGGPAPRSNWGIRGRGGRGWVDHRGRGDFRGNFRGGY